MNGTEEGSRHEARAGNLALIVRVAELLFVHGQTSQGTRIAVERLGVALKCPVTMMARWGELTFWTGDHSLSSNRLSQPLAVDMGRVGATEAIVDEICEGRISAAQAMASLQAVGRMPPVSVVRFATMAAAGAAALGVIFGAADALTITVIAMSAGAGGCLRRAVSHLTHNPFAQPFLAALLAGAIGSAVSGFGFPVSHRLVAVCPCMVLVPGPHFLNGTIDLARARIPLGAARVAFATLVVVAICTGLLLGLSIATSGLSDSGSTHPVPLAYDALAAGIAVAAYGSFFNMPWAMLPLPIGVGILAHAVRWELLGAGASVQTGAFVACLLVGAVMTPITHRLRIPFGAAAFASVVSLIPGVFMFQTASDILVFLTGNSTVSPQMLTELVGEAATAVVILLAMTSGLIFPKMCFDRMADTVRPRHS